MTDEELAILLWEQEQMEHDRKYSKDLALAKELQAQEEQQQRQLRTNIVGPSSVTKEEGGMTQSVVEKKGESSKYAATRSYSSEWHLTDIFNDPNPDLHQLFLLFNQIYFDNKLDMVEVKWSTKMTRCAGTCSFKTGNHCIVTLSEPLLKFRPNKDMISTLLHEMIHALLFITQRNTDRDGHGPEFLSEAKRVGELADVNITVYHSFRDEVDYYLTHVWQCNGVCKDKPPYYGLVKRAMNRPPQKADTWYEEHQLTCGGAFTKIKSPEPKTTSVTNSLVTVKKNKRKEEDEKQKRINMSLDNFFAAYSDEEMDLVLSQNKKQKTK